MPHHFASQLPIPECEIPLSVPGNGEPWWEKENHSESLDLYLEGCYCMSWFCATRWVVTS